LTVAALSGIICLMKTVQAGEFTRRFRIHRREPAIVKDRRKVLGTWTPAPKAITPLDVMARLKKDFSRSLPFTGAELLKAGKKR
jgi:hypothetical protein